MKGVDLPQDKEQLCLWLWRKHGLPRCSVGYRHPSNIYYDTGGILIEGLHDEVVFDFNELRTTSEDQSQPTTELLTHMVTLLLPCDPACTKAAIDAFIAYPQLAQLSMNHKRFAIGNLRDMLLEVQEHDTPNWPELVEECFIAYQ